MSTALGLKLTTSDSESSLTHELSDSFRQAYADHFALVFRGLRRLGVPESAVEDAVQDVFVVVHRRWRDFEGRSELKTWVYGIAVRVAKDYRRSEARRSRRVQRYAQLSIPEPHGELPSDRAERLEAHRLLYAALAKLDDEERAVFVLVELEELSVRETATALKLQLRTCQRRLKRARESFETMVSEGETSNRAKP